MDLLNARGRALTYIANHPRCTIKEMADGLFLTRRTVWGVIGELRHGHLIHIIKEGRKHRYEVKELSLREALLTLKERYD